MRRLLLMPFFVVALFSSAKAQLTEKWFLSSLDKTPYELGQLWNIQDLKVDETISFDVYGTRARLIPSYNSAQVTDSLIFLFAKEIKDSVVNEINQFVVEQYTSTTTKLNTYYTKSNYLLSVFFTEDLGLYVVLTKSDRPNSNNQNKIEILKELINYSLQLLNEEDYGQVAKIKELRNKIYDLRLQEDVYKLETDREREFLNEIMKFYSNIDLVTRFDHYLRRNESQVKYFHSKMKKMYN